jgi:regulator of cell morphogenesis and NO signaling
MNDVLEKITAVAQESPPANEVRWPDRTLTELCDHIEQTHHAYLKTELPRLEGIIAKVLSAHGANHPALQAVRSAFADLKAELEPHLFKEERILFPAIRQLEQSAVKLHFPFGTVRNPIQVMEHEHENAGAALQRIRQATANFQVPSDACNTYRVMLVGLEQLEQNMHQHVHKENNILFPRAKRLEQC